MICRRSVKDATCCWQIKMQLIEARGSDAQGPTRVTRRVHYFQPNVYAIES